MKKQIRLRALEDLLAQLDASDFDKREYALFQLGLMLDRSNLVGDDDLAERSLTRLQLRLRLSCAEQELVTERLTSLALRSQASRASAIWTLGKVDAVILLGPLLALIDALGKHLSDEAAYQACCALSKCLEVGEDGAAIPAPVRARLGAAQLSSVLERWRGSGSKRLQMTASAAAMIAQLGGKC